MIAIVIPYYNYLFFEETLQSLVDQTDKRFNVYIGDDCSPSDPSALIAKFKSLLSITYFRYDNNLGSISLSEQWNRCVSLIKDESWILVLGDDDKLGKNIVENFYHNFNEIINSGVSLVRFSTTLIDQNNNSISNNYTHEKFELAKDSLIKKFKNESRSSLTEYIFSKKAFDKFKFKHYPLAWHSDDRAWIDFSEKKPIYTINNSTTYIRFSEHSISGKKEYKQLKSDANYLFFIDLIKTNLNYTNADFRFLADKFILFLKLQKKFSIETCIFLISAFFRRKQFTEVFYVIREFVRYKIQTMKKTLKKLMK